MIMGFRRQLGVFVFLIILVTGYAPHFTVFSGKRFNRYAQGEVSLFHGRVSGSSSPPFSSGLPAQVDVELQNLGDTDANGVEVQLRYSDWGVGVTTFFDLDTKLVDIPAGESMTVSFFPIFNNRAQVALEVSFTAPPSANVGPDENENLSDRQTGGLDEIPCDSDCSFTVPMRNDGNEDLSPDVQVLCLHSGEDEPKPCAPKNNVQLVNPPTTIPGSSEVLLEVDADLDEGESLTVVVQDRSDPALSYNEVAVTLVHTTAVRILNSPVLCCLSSVRFRAALGSYLAAALSALDKDDPATAIALLRFFVQRALGLIHATTTPAEVACLERAVRLVAGAARIIARDDRTPLPNKAAALAESDFLRRAGDHAASALFLARAAPSQRPEVANRLVQWPEPSLVGDAPGRSWLPVNKWTHVAVAHGKDALSETGGGGGGGAVAEVQALKRRLRRKARRHVKRARRHLRQAITGPQTFAAQADVGLMEASRELLESSGTVLELHEGGTAGQWQLETTESVSLAQDNPIFVAQPGASTNILHGRRRLETEEVSLQEAEAAAVDAVMGMGALARKHRHARARAIHARHAARHRQTRRDDAALLGNGVDDDCTGRQDLEAVWKDSSWPPKTDTVDTPVLAELLGCVESNLKEGGRLSGELEQEVGDELVTLFANPLAVMRPAALEQLEQEAQLTKEAEAGAHCGDPDRKRVGLCCVSERRAGDAEEGEGGLPALLGLYERVLDLMDDTAFWVEVARDATREGGGVLTGSATTMRADARGANPRVTGETYWYTKEGEGGEETGPVGLAMTEGLKVQTWKSDGEGDGMCAEGQCECDVLGDGEGVCVASDPAEEPQTCTCGWVAADWSKEVPDVVTVVSSVEVTSRRKGQPLRTLAQDIRVEVQTMKNEGRRRSLIGLEQDGIHKATYGSIMSVGGTASTMYKKGDRISLVGFGSFSVSERAARTGRRGKRRAGGRRVELDHVGAYNFMVEISGVAASSLQYGTTEALTGSSCADTYEPVEVFEFSEDAALKLRQRLLQPDYHGGARLDAVEGSCALASDPPLWYDDTP